MSVWFEDLEWVYDPKTVIPGDPVKLYEDANKLTTWSAALDGIADDLSAVRVAGWTGKASDAFWDDFSPQKKRWHRGADALSAAADALRSYADMLSWAQSVAADVLDKYHNGDKDGARTTLASVQSKLDAEGQAAAKKFKAQDGSASDAPDWLYWAGQAASQSDTGKTKIQLAEAKPERLRQEKKRTFGDQTGEKKRPEGGVTVAGQSVSGDAKVWGAEAKDHGHALGGDVSGKASMNLLGVEGQAGYGVHNFNATASASGKAYLAQATAEGSYQAGYFEASGKAEGFVGAEATAKASAGKDGVHAGVEAFAGAKATAEGHASVAGVGVGGTAEAWAGVGAEANVDLGMKDGKFVIGGDLGLGLGVGAKLGGSVEVDPGKVVDAAGDAADAVEDWGGDTVDAVTSIF